MKHGIHLKVSGDYALFSRPKFREVAELLTKMDRLVIRFRKSAPGAAFADAWTASRIIRDLGSSGSGEEPEPPTPTA
jgi:hypothetical protein